MWLRNNVSTMLSQFINTLIFVTIAFYGIQPVGKLIVGHYIGKLVIALLDTPLIYIAVHIMRKKLDINKGESMPLFEKAD